MLERIKHYFDDDRIIFVVSVNKEQLIHTISNYYGTGFDSTGYLNKFFDLDAHLPELQTYDTEKEERMENGYERFKVAYNFLFGNAEKEEVSEVRLEIDRSLKEKILECCGQMSINS